MESWSRQRKTELNEDKWSLAYMLHKASVKSVTVTELTYFLFRLEDTKLQSTSGIRKYWKMTATSA